MQENEISESILEVCAENFISIDEAQAILEAVFNWFSARWDISNLTSDKIDVFTMEESEDIDRKLIKELWDVEKDTVNYSITRPSREEVIGDNA